MSKSDRLSISRTSGSSEHCSEKQQIHDDEYLEDGLSDHILHGFPLFSCVVAICLCLLIDAMDQTLVLTFISEVGSEFDDFGKVNWVISSFLLSGAVLAMTWGKLSLIFGRKYCMLAGIAFFFFGSIICALSKSMNVLIVGRCITGIGGGCIQVCVFLIITEIVPINLRGTFQGVLGAVFGLSSVTAPLIGGALSQVSWRLNFWIALPLTAVGVIALAVFYHPPVPEGSLKDKFKQIDYIGIVLLSTGLVLVLLALTLGSTSTPWNSAIVICFLVVGGILTVVYFVYNFTICKHPMFPKEVFSLVQVLAPCFTLFFQFGGFMASMIYLATYFQIVWDQSPLQSGISLLPEILSVIVMSIVIGILISKTRLTKPYVLFGSAVASIGMGLLSLLDENTSNGKRIGYLIVPGLGIGCLFQSVGMSVQVAARKKKSNNDSTRPESIVKKESGDAVLIATAGVTFGKAIGGVVGSCIGQTILSSVFMSQLSHIALPGGVGPISILNSPDIIKQLPPDVSDEVIKAFVSGFRMAMYLAMAMEIAGFASSWFLTSQKVPNPENTTKPSDEEAVIGST